MTDEKGRAERRAARNRRLLINGLLLVPAFVLVRFPLSPGDRPIVQVLSLLCLAVLLVYDLYQLTLVLRRRRATRAARVDGRWPLGADYAIAIDEPCNGTREPGTMVFGDRELRLTWTMLQSTSAFELAAIHTVRVRPSFVEIDTGDSRIRVVPGSFEMRQRLLWEFAVRCNAAVEHGIDEAADSERAWHETTKPASFVPHADDPPPPPAATRSESTDSLDRGMSSLGSALAGPAHRPNPAPPRKSGLGNGLFVVPDGDGG